MGEVRQVDGARTGEGVGPLADGPPDRVPAVGFDVWPAREALHQALGVRLGQLGQQAKLRPVLRDSLVHLIVCPRQAECARPHREPAVGGAKTERPGLYAARLQVADDVIGQFTVAVELTRLHVAVVGIGQLTHQGD